MEGFWTVKFNGIQGWGAGVITLMGGQLYGGDSSFLYTGTYTQNGDGMQAHVHVKKYFNVPGMQNVMGRDEFDLELAGTNVSQGNIINVAGTIPGTQLRFSATLAKQGEFPQSA